VEKDADIEKMTPLLVKGGFYHAGQVCVSVQRVFVQKDIAKEVAEKMAEQARKLKVGNQLEEDTEVGPLITPYEVDRVEECVQEAVDCGAELLCGGQRISDTCYQPTVLLNPPENAKVSQEEVFGPVVCVYAYADLNEAIDRANALDLHFQAAVFTSDVDVALEAGNKLNATAVMVNDHTAFRVDWMPFGGRDTSGMGLGGIQYSMHDMTREKLIVFKSAGIP
jgi:acyl-CoA reductase-like NAD-dependent aldehyde dehydrogenase